MTWPLSLRQAPSREKAACRVHLECPDSESHAKERCGTAGNTRIDGTYVAWKKYLVRRSAIEPLYLGGMIVSDHVARGPLQ